MALPSTFIVGAYATAPRPNPSSGLVDRAEEAAFYAALHAIPSLGGFEVPLLAGGVLHSEDEPWLLSVLFGGQSQQVNIVLTCVPASVSALGADPTCGLASDAPAGRQAALAIARQARDAVARLNAAAGNRGRVVAVEFVSAPCTIRASSSEASLTASLIEIGAWDWEGAALVVEHCDAAVDGRVSAKGYLPLKDEVNAVRAANAALAPASGAALPFGISLNWGRSVIEGQDAEAALVHIATAGPLLRGFIFSGCSASDGAYGAAWADAHLPLASDAPESLLTVDKLRAAVVAAKAAAATPLLFLGAKLTLQPRGASPAARAAVNASLLSELATIAA